MKDLPKSYQPKEYEDDIYRKWEESDSFNPDKSDSKKTYSIVMPPPNVTGILHLGHAAMLALEDIMVRYRRMDGYKTLWVPGTDHAAIATQAKVEQILKQEGTNRHELGKEKFLGRVEQFASESHDTIASQIRKMGSSCDWSREAYTLDKTRTKAVRLVFKLMYDDGLIYRGDRVVNWCPRCHSTLSDDEVEYKAQRAKLYTFKYDKDFPIAVSSTRPETKLADTAVAVNPKDERYKKYIGKKYEVNFCGQILKLSIVADRNVDMNFGTGALGVTPAHSMADWKMAEEQGLEVIKLINEDGKIGEGFGEFSGLNAKEARKQVVKILKEENLIVAEEEIDNNLSICYRCDTPIEPLPSLQWFIDVEKPLDKFGGKTIKDVCRAVVKDGFDFGEGKKKIDIYPQRFEKNYFHWMDNLGDWCISRQILFGHRVPVWYREPKDKSQKIKDKETYVGVEAPEGDDWVQDTDTLDTWFSSGLWTFSTLAQKPEDIKIKDGKIVIDTEDFKNFHPNSVMETGYDILFFWVARMILMTTYAIEDIPFKDIYLHGLILDEKGKKMSKSKGNVIDPLDLNDKYGADAARLSLVIGTSPGADIKLSEEKVASYGKFSNKLWNISRFIVQKVDDSKIEEFKDSKIEIDNLSVADEWILIKLQTLVKQVSDDIENYKFSQAGEMLREFTWDDLADWYIEITKFEKSENKDYILLYILETILKLWHPYIPFVTESVWQQMGKENMLISESWPKGAVTSESKSNFELIVDIIKAIRNARSINSVESAKKIKAVIYAGDKKDFVKSQEVLIRSLRTGIEELEVKETGEEIKNEIFTSVSGVKIYLIGAIDPVKEKKRLETEIDGLAKLIKITKAKLDNKSFVEKAPESIVGTEKQKLADYEEKISDFKKQLENYN